MTLALNLWDFNTCRDCLSTQTARPFHTKAAGASFQGFRRRLDTFLEEENQSRAINYKDTATGWGHALATNHWKLKKCSGAVPTARSPCACALPKALGLGCTQRQDTGLEGDL